VLQTNWIARERGKWEREWADMQVRRAG